MKTAGFPFKVVVILLAVIALVVAARAFPLADELERFNTWVQEQGSAGMLIFALAYAVAVVILLPAFMLTMAGGATFGLLPGVLTVQLGASLGAVLAFMVSRHLARKRVGNWIETKPSFSAIDKAVAREGWKIVFLTRLSPLFPFIFQNYAYGLTRVSLRHFTLGSFVGMFPGTVIYVYVGALGKNSLEAAVGIGSVQGLELVLQFVGLVATALVTVLITRRATTALQGKIESM